jgi:hypothetical protein
LAGDKPTIWWGVAAASLCLGDGLAPRGIILFSIDIVFCLLFIPFSASRVAYSLFPTAAACWKLDFRHVPIFIGVH